MSGGLKDRSANPQDAGLDGVFQETLIEPSPLHSGHRSRLKQRFMNCSQDVLPDYELLELLLALAALSSQGRQRRALKPAEYYPRGQKVTIKPQRYVVAKSAGDTIVAATDVGGVSAAGTSHSKAKVLLKKHEQANPGFLFQNANEYGVVCLHELPEAG